MSDTCGNCDCTDRSQCTKKRNAFGVEMVEIGETVSMEYEMEGKGSEGDCKCGPDCACNPCTCGR